MGVDAALLRGEAEEVPPVDRNSVGGGKIVSQKNVLSIRRMMMGVIIEAEIPQHPLRHVFDVRSSFPEIRIRYASHRFKKVLHHRVKCKLGVLLSLVDGVRNPVKQDLVLQEHHVGFENLAVSVSRKRL